MAQFTLLSDDIKGQVSNYQLFDGNGCSGENLSPHLHWTNTPLGTKSFVVTLHDPDAPTPSGWWHWCAFNISPTTIELQTGQSGKLGSDVIETLNDYGQRGYGGACPPEGDRFHTYVYTVYALSAELDLDDNASPAMVCFMAEMNLLAKASLISYKKR